MSEFCLSKCSLLPSLATLQRLAHLTVNSILWVGGKEEGDMEVKWWREGAVALRERDTLIFRNVRRVNVENRRLGI